MDFINGWKTFPGMLKLEMQCTPRSLWHHVWWRVMPGVEVVVKWPRGSLVVDNELIPSADPNDHYRPFLEKHLGWQGWDWDWRIDNVANDTLRIKIRRRHKELATMLALKWA